MTYFGILRNLAYFSHVCGGRSVYFAPRVCFCECMRHRSGPKRALRIYTHWPVAAVELEFRSDSECLLTTDLRPSLLLMLNDFDQDLDFALVLGQCNGMTYSFQVCKSTHCSHFAQCLVTVLLSDPSESKNNSKVVNDMMVIFFNQFLDLLV